MLKDGMSLCNSCGRSTSGVECTNPGCQDALASARLASVTAERDALAAQLASLKKRVADAPKACAFVRQDSGLQVDPPPWRSRLTGEHVRVALLRLEDGE